MQRLAKTVENVFLLEEFSFIIFKFILTISRNYLKLKPFFKYR